MKMEKTKKEEEEVKMKHKKLKMRCDTEIQIYYASLRTLKSSRCCMRVYSIFYFNIFIKYFHTHSPPATDVNSICALTCMNFIEFLFKFV
jgi:hypothetical protein